MPVYQWMVIHVYKPVLRAGFSPTTAGFACFLISATFHEVRELYPTGVT